MDGRTEGRVDMRAWTVGGMGGYVWIDGETDGNV